MTLLDDLYDTLAADSGVTNIVSTHIYQGAAKASTAAIPYLLLEEVQGDGKATAEGPSGLVNATVGVECYEDKPADALTLGDKVRLALDGLSHVKMGAASTDVRQVHLMARNTISIPPAFGNGAFLSMRRLVFKIWHAESIPSH